jgi:enterochelin esterase family protein
MRAPAIALLVALATPAAAQPAEPPPPLDHATLARALGAKPTGAQASALADKVRLWFGADAIKTGGTPKSEGQEVAWAIEAPGAQSVSAQPVDGFPKQKLEQIGTTGVWAAVTTLSDGTAARFFYSVDNRRLGLFDVEAYTPHPDSLPRPGVPRGKVIAQAKWKSRVFAGTERDWWIYVPAQYKPSQPAAVMVFQDGLHYVKEVPPVFDNLIHEGAMPVTVGVFVNPGVFADGKSNRTVEYDVLSADYARFLVDEILPAVEKTAKLRHDPESRALAGRSSGAICAFTAAWERPDQFRKVLSWIGTFVNIAEGASHREGGHNYEALIRRLPRKPIRVFLQDGENDREEDGGSWWLANQQMERSLRWANWDFRAQWGHGFHSPRHGLAILPDSLRWLWRDWKSAR